MSIDLIRTPHGWTYPEPGPCNCGETGAWVSFQFYQCASANGGGYPQWRCKACGETRTIGCSGVIAVRNEYGARGGASRK